MGKYAATTSQPNPNLFGTLEFKKTGREIAEQANNRIKELHSELEKVKVAAAQLCSKYKIDIDEAVSGEEAREDDDLVGSFRNSGYGNSIAQSAIMQTSKVMKDDLEEISKFAREILGIKQRINTFNTLARNIEPNREFNLTFQQVITLGF